MHTWRSHFSYGALLRLRYNFIIPFLSKIAIVCFLCYNVVANCVRHNRYFERKIKMSFDGITTSAVVHELNSKLQNARIEKIYVPNKSEIILSVHTQDRNNYKLLISIDANNSRLHLTTKTRENPITAPQFCMILRKYLIFF